MGKQRADSHFVNPLLVHQKPRQFSKERRAYGNPVAVTADHPRFIPPFPTNRTNLNLPLGVVVPHVNDRVEQSGKLVFHFNGDTGGIHGTDVQEAIAAEMELQCSTAAQTDAPAFFYHLGDVVYFNGMSRDYETQFYEPYKYYPAPIFAIAGNHDGDTQTRANDEPDDEPTLTGFRLNFCDDQPRYRFKYRQTMTQPYVYWTLETPVATIIGLYSNVDGLLDGRGTNEQQLWLQQQLIGADKDKCLLIAVHHPPYSLDGAHGGSPDILVALDSAMRTTGRYPDAVYSGHVHNYQRFTRSLGDRQIPYVVAGAAGYANKASSLHKLQVDYTTRKRIEKEKLPYATTEAGVTLAAFNDTDPGFLRLSIDMKQKTLLSEYFLVPFSGDPPAHAIDHFTLNWESHKISEGGRG